MIPKLEDEYVARRYGFPIEFALKSHVSHCITRSCIIPSSFQFMSSQHLHQESHYKNICDENYCKATFLYWVDIKKNKITKTNRHPYIC